MCIGCTQDGLSSCRGTVGLKFQKAVGEVCRPLNEDALGSSDGPTCQSTGGTGTLHKAESILDTACRSLPRSPVLSPVNSQWLVSYLYQRFNILLYSISLLSTLSSLSAARSFFVCCNKRTSENHDDVGVSLWTDKPFIYLNVVIVTISSDSISNDQDASQTSGHVAGFNSNLQECIYLFSFLKQAGLLI